MSHNYYSEINLHIVWHTKTSSPLLTPNVEPLARRFLKKRIIDTPQAIHARSPMNGTQRIGCVNA